MFGILFAILFVISGAPLLAQQTSSLETIVGTYAVRGETAIFVPTPNGDVPVPEVHVGIASFTREGTVQTTFVGSMRGDPFEAQSTGTVEVNEDCTATLKATMTIGGNVSKSVQHMMLLDNGDQMVNMTAPSNYRGVGGNVLKRLSKSPVDQFAALSPCSTEMVRGVYAFYYEGDAFMSAPGSAAPVQLHGHMIGTSWIDHANRMPGKFDYNLGGNRHLR